MKSRAAVLHGTDQEWRIEDIEVDVPKAGEVIVEWKAAGLCHSDEHWSPATWCHRRRRGR